MSRRRVAPRSSIRRSFSWGKRSKSRGTAVWNRDGYANVAAAMEIINGFTRAVFVRGIPRAARLAGAEDMKKLILGLGGGEYVQARLVTAKGRRGTSTGTAIGGMDQKLWGPLLGAVDSYRQMLMTLSDDQLESLSAGVAALVLSLGQVATLYVT